MLSQYVNLYFPVCSMITTLILCIVYFSKKKVNNLDTSIYKFLLITGMIESLLMFITNLLVCFFFVPENYFMFEVLNKLLYCIYIIWLTILFVYIYKLGNNKNIKYILVICSVINLFLMLMIFISPIKLYYQNGLTNSSGIASNYLYIGCSIYLFMMIVISLIGFKKVTYKKKYLPLALLLVLMSFMMIIRQYDPLFNISSNVLSLVVLVMYFTIENPDVKMLKEVTLAKNQAEKSDKAKSEFISSMSHEIRTPLNAIVGYSQLIDYAETLDEAKENSKDIVNSSNTLLNMLSNVLDISMIDVGEMTLKNVKYDINDIIDNIVNLFKYKLEEKNLKLDLNIDEFPSLYGDSDKIKRILANLIDNAIKYTDNGSISILAKKDIKEDKCNIVMSVKDTGKGIDNKTKEKLFSNFNRAEEHMDSDISGMGLGLSITKSLIELMGGKIVCESKVNEGTTFTLYLSQRTGE